MENVNDIALWLDTFHYSVMETGRTVNPSSLWLARFDSWVEQILIIYYSQKYMFISKKEYEELLSVKEKFDQKDETAKVKDLEETVCKLVKDAMIEKEAYERKAKQNSEDYTRELSRVESGYREELDRMQNKVDVEVSEKTLDLQNEIVNLKIKAANSEKEAEILTTAFKNLGFDVKDMKEILNKLVDGIVAKNTPAPAQKEAKKGGDANN